MKNITHPYRWWKWRMTLRVNTFARKLERVLGLRFAWLRRPVVGVAAILLIAVPFMASAYASQGRPSAQSDILQGVGGLTLKQTSVQEAQAKEAAAPKKQANKSAATAKPTESIEPVAVPAATEAVVDAPLPATLSDGGSGVAIPPIEVLSAGAVSVDDTNAGAKGRYTGGQCTYYVASKRNIPGGWGNAKNWKSAAERAGYKTGKVPAKGAVAWTSKGWAGHVAIVDDVSPDGSQVTVSEMNFRGAWRTTSRTVPASTFGAYIY